MLNKRAEFKYKYKEKMLIYHFSTEDVNWANQ